MLLDGVWFSYGRRSGWTLRDVRAVVRPGETVVVLGRNGAGKSTLLQLAAGVLHPGRGVVRDRPPVVGWVPERFPADQPFTARQYLMRMAAARGLTASTATRTIGALAGRLLFTEHLGSPLPSLSKGTAQKVGLAQALLVTLGLLVLDEPWEGLDATARTLVPQIVAEVTGAGGAVLVSDHRGEIAGLPDAIRWSVDDATVRTNLTAGDPGAAGDPGTAVEPGSAGDPGMAVVEVAVRQAELDAVVDGLRAGGHRIIGVRPAPSTAPR